MLLNCFSHGATASFLGSLFGLVFLCGCGVSPVDAGPDDRGGENGVSLVLRRSLDYWIVAEGSLGNAVTCRFGENFPPESAGESCADTVCGHSWEVPLAYEFFVRNTWRNNVAIGDRIVVFIHRSFQSGVASVRGGTGDLFLAMSLIDPTFQPFSECNLTGAFQAEGIFAIETTRSPEYYDEVREDLSSAEPLSDIVATGYRVPDCLRQKDVYFEDGDVGSCSCPDTDFFVPSEVTGLFPSKLCPEHLQ